MIYKRFEEGDILHNTLEANPEVRISISNKKIYIKNYNPTVEDVRVAKESGQPLSVQLISLPLLLTGSV